MSPFYGRSPKKPAKPRYDNGNHALAVTDDMMGRSAGRAGASPALVSLPQIAGKLPLPVWLYLLAVVIPIGFQAGPLAMTTLRLLLLVMIVPLMIQLLMGRYGKILITDILFVAHIGWAVVALAVNNPDQVVQQVGSVGMEFLGGYVMGRAYIRTPEAFAALCRALVLIVLCTVPLALHEALTGRPLLIEYLRRFGLTATGIVTIEGRMGLERVQAVFAHPIHYGLFCSVAFSLAFVALQDMTGGVRRYVSSALIAGAGFLALSSGALLAISAQIALILWAAIFAKVTWRWWLLLGLFAVAYVIIDIFSNRTPIKVFMSYATFSAHNAYWRSIIFEWGMKSVWIHPLYGIGMNDWVRPWYMHSGSMDNFWLVMAVRYGIPGFVPLALGFIIAIARIMRRDFAGDAMLILFRRAWVFTFLGLSFTMSTVHIWTNVYSFVFFMFGAGMWLITAKSGPASGLAKDAAQTLPARQIPPASQGMAFSAAPVSKATAAHYTRFPPVPPNGDGGRGRGGKIR